MKRIINTFLFLSLAFSTAFAQVGRIMYLDFNTADANEVKSLIGEKTKKFNNTLEGEKIYTFQVAAGEKNGQLVRFLYADSFGQIEAYPQKGNEWWWKNVSPKITNSSGTEFLQYAEDASHNIAKPGENKVWKVLFYKIKPGEGESFWRYRKNVAKAAAELGDEISLRVWSSSIGGIPGRVLVTYAHKDYTGLDNESESWPKVVKKYNEMFNGNYNADNVAFSKSLEMWGNYSELWRFLPELSSPVPSS